jgi:16S rRNA processing protein RimM
MSDHRQEQLEPLIAVARAVKTRGLKGEIIAELLTDFPERFETTLRLIGVAQNGQRRTVELERFWFHQDRLVLKLAGYDSIESASALIGYEFAVPESERVQLAEDQFYNWELEGCAVETVGGESIGNVREVMSTRGMNTLVVEDDAHHEYLIPIAHSIVLGVDIVHKRIQVDPPEGLLEL